MADKLEVLSGQERVLRQLGKKEELAMVLGSQSDVLAARGEVQAAVRKLQEAETLFREIGHDFGIDKTLFDQVRLLRDQDRPRELLQVLQRQEARARASGDDDDLALCLSDQAIAHHELEDLDGELRVLDELIPLRRKGGDHHQLTFCLGAAAICLFRTQGDLKKALRLATEAEEISRKLDDPADLARSLNTKALVLAGLGRNADALDSAKESYRVAERHGIQQWIQMNRQLIAALES